MKLQHDSGIGIACKVYGRGRHARAVKGRVSETDGNAMRERQVFLRETCHKQEPTPVLWIAVTRLLGGVAEDADPAVSAAPLHQPCACRVRFPFRTGLRPASLRRSTAAIVSQTASR